MSFSNNTSLKSHCKVFLETGTFHGDGVQKALNAGFSKIISIEVYEPLYQENLNKFSEQIKSGVVEIILGDSAHVIGESIKLIDEPIMFWFDAHDQTMNQAGVGDVKCPIIKELKNIISHRELHKRRLDVLIIDDMRLIINKNVGWNIDMTEFYEVIWNYNPEFKLTRERGYIDYDILRCEYKNLI
jgi:hypothetical protein